MCNLKYLLFFQSWNVHNVAKVIHDNKYSKMGDNINSNIIYLRNWNINNDLTFVNPRIMISIVLRKSVFQDPKDTSNRQFNTYRVDRCLLLLFKSKYHVTYLLRMCIHF